MAKPESNAKPSNRMARPGIRFDRFDRCLTLDTRLLSATNDLSLDADGNGAVTEGKPIAATFRCPAMHHLTSPGKGWGVFATKRINQGALILREKPLFVIWKTQEEIAEQDV
ncbi:hypothetical protein B0J13DRAFT_613187 [Dactylonectria estremocensis]|uniref:SET domain-containing protein n=1 Tax=Dactylonectria estremocensis TaxID=1079267 RepID=A0A9P9DCR0_9HYPO|nr:hypothetical protein B0J13DRAFT_613187 [Dactylonectria estremocensis]